MKKFGIYMHWPFCLSKCPYCDFYSKPSRDFKEDILKLAYFRDIEQLPVYPHLTSFFFGGGTPSLMSPALIEEILKKASDKFSFSPDIEISLEANPETLTPNKIKDFKAAGINRLSVGVQALDEKDLRFLGRIHSLSTALKCLENVATVFDNFSLDLIYARPDQTLTAWAKELDMALSFHAPHYSLYQLTIEDGTPFARKGIKGADDEIARQMYLMTLDRMEKAKIPPYEVSNFARKGYQSKHNLLYWQGDDYAGIGPAAHGRLGLLATENPADIGLWIKGEKQTVQLTQEERFEEKIIMGTRLFSGISAKGLSQNNIQKAVQNKWITFDGKNIKPTREGILMQNSLSLTLLSD